MTRDAAQSPPYVPVFLELLLRGGRRPPEAPHLGHPAAEEEGRPAGMIAASKKEELTNTMDSR